MQLLCCYDLVAGKESPFSDLFDQADWLGFQYMRDIKYHYSEGYGSTNPGLYATPWLDAAMKVLRKPLLYKAPNKRLPLWIGFTHREEILYLCVLLVIAWQELEPPRTDRIDENRRWRVSSLAPYLSHIGLELFRTVESVPRVRIIINGQVVPALQERLKQDSDGGYDIEHRSYTLLIQKTAVAMTLADSRTSGLDCNNNVPEASGRRISIAHLINISVEEQ